MTRVSCSITPANPGMNRLLSDRSNHDIFQYIGFNEKFAHQAIRHRLDQQQDPWGYFLGWESEWQARDGITQLRAASFLTLGNAPYTMTALTLANCYPDIKGTSDVQLDDDVAFVTAAVRQAKEYYRAGETVSELTRPTLMYYSAVMLAKAAAVAWVGLDYVQNQKGHGLVSKNAGRSLDGSTTPWPTFITWQPSGDFVALYRTGRWDQYWTQRSKQDAWPQFHITECLRSVGIIPSPEFFTASLPINHLLWSVPDPSDLTIPPNTVESAVQTPCFEVPRAARLLMILFWLGVMSRYHPVAWRALLAGQAQDGYYFRRALEEVPRQFVRSMHEVLMAPYRVSWSKPSPTTPADLDPAAHQQAYRLIAHIDGPVPPGCETE